MSKICECFHHNGFKANPWKILFFTKPICSQTKKIMGSTTKASKEKLLAMRSEN